MSFFNLTLLAYKKTYSEMMIMAKPGNAFQLFCKINELTNARMREKISRKFS